MYLLDFKSDIGLTWGYGGNSLSTDYLYGIFGVEWDGTSSEKWRKNPIYPDDELAYQLSVCK